MDDGTDGDGEQLWGLAWGLAWEESNEIQLKEVGTRPHHVGLAKTITKEGRGVY